jgi:NhaP-type Na+/H+ or K+/H+ antiporter
VPVSSDLLIGLASIVILGISAQWLAWRLRLPSILILLVFGFIAGPISGFLDPDRLLGDLLLPLVSLSVAIILLEGGLNLRLSELRGVGRVVINLVTVGVIVSWIIIAVAAYFLLDLDFALSILLGAILIVTGPTVIRPLLRYLRPTRRVAAILKWEGIIIDPIGAILAVLVFEAILAGGIGDATTEVAINLAATILYGGLFGVLGAFVVTKLLKGFMIPDFLHNAVTLIVAIAAFTLSDYFQSDSGLVAVVVMGIGLANQRSVSVRHIVEFKENLTVLLISGLFILLAARLNIDDLGIISLGSFVFLAVIFFVARPVSVFLSTYKTELSANERIFISSLAPRGIVAAAIASVFAIRLEEIGYPQAEVIVPLTFMIIIATVTFYGLTASPLARWLKVAQPKPQGILIVGAHSWGREIAKLLKEEGFQVQLVDPIRANVSAARLEGIPVFYGNVLSQYASEELDLSGLGKLLALTSDDEYNSLVVLHFANLFGRANTFQILAPDKEKSEKQEVSEHLRGRLAFRLTYDQLTKYHLSGYSLKVTSLTDAFGYQDYIKYFEDLIPLFIIDQNKNLEILTAIDPIIPQSGSRVISIVKQK